MNIHFGFSYIGLIFLLMLMLPNIIWSKNKPKGYDKYVKNENKVLLLLEWLGEMLVTCLSLIFSDFNINKISNWSSILLIAFIIMILYEIYWIRYFKSNKTMKDMYSSLLGIPVAGATLPVVAFLLLGIYGRNIFLIISTIVLGIGHIGIHLNHKKELGINVNIEIIGDMQKMMALGVMRTPALIIDDEVVLQGRIPKKEEIKRLLQK